MSGATVEADERLMTRREVADRFGIGLRWLELAATTGGGPPMVKIGRAVRYRPADVRAWIAARTVASTSAPLPPGAPTTEGARGARRGRGRR